VSRSLIACDFDGTITRRDTLHLIVEHFGDRSVWDRIEPDLRAGRVSIEEAMEAEFATVRAEPGAVLEVVRREAGVREGFGRFVAWAEAAGHRLVVFSNGFRVVIEDVLERAGAGHLPVYCHDAEFSPAGTRLVWSARGEVCGLCGRHCKRHELEGVREGDRVVYLGDGISDRCVSGAADVLFARDTLADWLVEQGRPYVPFEDFDDVREHLDGPARVAA
jgi:2-hydroxy-3-keto-5-methylthiopentenyl-1-phosphate phosphatase